MLTLYFFWNAIINSRLKTKEQMELILIRHGETAFNKDHKLMGKRIDAPLDETGIEQAKEVIAKLPEDFAAIYSSPLKRAAQTAHVIADYFGKEVIYRNELVERDFGSLSGHTWNDIDKEFGGHVSKADENLEYDYTLYGGENMEHVKERLNTFLEEMKSKHKGEKVVVVTHYGLIKIMDSLYPNKQHHRLSNTSIHKYEI